MGFFLEDGTGTGLRVRVTGENQLETQAEVHELQHHISIRDGQVYQAIGTHTLTTSGAKTILHMKNDDADRLLIVSYMRLQFPGGDGTIDDNTYFIGGFDTLYSAGGNTVSPVNMNRTSGNVANATVYHNNPNVTGSLEEFDRWYSDKSMQTFNKHGSIILGLGDTMEWRIQTDQSSGEVYVRITLMMIDRASI